MKNSKNKGLNYFLTFAIFALLAGIAVHIYNYNVLSKNKEINKKHQQVLVKYNNNNIYYEPQKTIQWLATRQNGNGYFVANPDLINEPSQLNANSLRATRYAISTLAELGGLTSINQAATTKFILKRYQETVDNDGLKVAGFATLTGQELGVRPTMDAILTLQGLSELNNDKIDLVAIENFILSHQNEDGGFWDPHYPKYQQVSCLKCSSFAMRALGALKKHTGQQFSPKFINQLVRYINASWDPRLQSYAELQGHKANDSYDIFRAFISLWNLQNTDRLSKQTFTLKHFNLRSLEASLKTNFETKEHVYSRKISPNKNSMKATHLMVWMFHQLNLDERLNQQAIINFVQSNQTMPGEYGGDIYNTYSATGIFKKLNVSTAPLPYPKEPLLKQSGLANYLPYLLYALAGLMLVIFGFSNKKQMERKTHLLERKINKDTLTGLFSRDYLENAYLYHSTTNEQASFILIDIDEFKLVNDNFGHLTGDHALQEISQLISSNIRKTDVLARWGGEEFAILCPATTLDAAKILAEKLRILIEQYRFQTIGNLTCSFGISSSHIDDELELLFDRADKALYQSKANGRNQVTYISDINLVVNS